MNCFIVLRMCRRDFVVSVGMGIGIGGYGYK